MKPGIKLVALVCGLLLPVGAWAVDQSDSPRLSTSRGHLQISWNADGTMGGWNLGSGQTGEPDMFWYPGWANIPSSNASSNYTRRGGNAVGFGNLDHGGGARRRGRGLDRPQGQERRYHFAGL